MRLQLEIMLSVIKKTWFWLGILVFLSLIKIVLYTFNVHANVSYEAEFLSFLFIPGFTNYNLSTLLIGIYQTILVIYIVYVFYTYELNNAFFNVILRANEKKWIVSKLLLITIFNILFKLIYQFLIYLYFKNYIFFELEYFLYPVVYDLLLSLFIILMINFINKNKLIGFVVIILLSFIIFKYFNVFIALFLIGILIAVNIFKFHFKWYYKL